MSWNQVCILQYLPGSFFMMEGEIFLINSSLTQCPRVYSLAWAELRLTMFAFIRQFGGRVSLVDTTYEDDIACESDHFMQFPRRDGGVKVAISSL